MVILNICTFNIVVSPNRQSKHRPPRRFHVHRCWSRFLPHTATVASKVVCWRTVASWQRLPESGLVVDMAGQAVSWWGDQLPAIPRMQSLVQGPQHFLITACPLWKSSLAPERLKTPPLQQSMWRKNILGRTKEGLTSCSRPSGWYHIWKAAVQMVDGLS